MSETPNMTDWRIGYHLEAAAKIIAAALDRLADAQRESTRVQERILAVQEENVSTGRRIGQEMTDLLLHGPGGRPEEPTTPPQPPEWVRDAIKGD